MKKFIAVLLTCLLLISISTTLSAHSGRTDSNGGHNKTSDGTYHYHNGNDRTIEYSSKQGSTPKQTSTQAPSESPKPAATVTPTPAQSQSAARSISEYYEEFPSVPNLGYAANAKLIGAYEESGAYVYQYDLNDITYDKLVLYAEKLGNAGFTDYEVIENGVAVRSKEILILAGYKNDGFYVTIGHLPSSKNEDLQEIAVIVSGETIAFDQPPENINGRIMVPIRYVVEKMGCMVEWDGDTQTVYINSSEIPLEKNAKKTGNINVRVNNEPIIFADQQPVNKKGRILIPVRFVTEKLGYSVEWDNELRIVYIDKKD